MRTNSSSIDPTTGEFSGYAWAENLGWLSLSLTATISGTPAVGDGFWFLVRGVNCKGKGTHDSSGAG